MCAASITRLPAARPAAQRDQIAQRVHADFIDQARDLVADHRPDFILKPRDAERLG